jgi:hypothetical protein
MPRTRKDEAPVAMESEVLTSRLVQLGEFTVAFDEFHVDADGTPMFKGLPDDRCQCPHWGVVLSGEVRLRYAEGEETFTAGDAYLARPGHVPVVTAGTEVIEFSPTAELATTLSMLGANMASASGGQP